MNTLTMYHYIMFSAFVKTRNIWIQNSVQKIKQCLKKERVGSGLGIPTQATTYLAAASGVNTLNVILSQWMAFL